MGFDANPLAFESEGIFLLTLWLVSMYKGLKILNYLYYVYRKNVSLSKSDKVTCCSRKNYWRLFGIKHSYNKKEIFEK